MHKFKYIGGLTATDHVDSRMGVDERKGVDMPDVCTAFGHKFIIGQPVDLKKSAFRSPAHYDHAVGKLRANRFFEEVVIEDARVVEETPAPKRGSKSKAIVSAVADGEIE